MTHHPPLVEPPSREDIRALAERFNFDLDEGAIDAHRELVASRMGALERLDVLPEVRTPLRYTDRQSGSRPDREEDPLNAWITRCRVDGADDGPLSGYDVGVKDNVAVAGVPMTCSSKTLEGYVPDADAFAVEGVLDAGGTVVGKTNMDEMAVSGSGEMTMFGPVVNPHDDDYLAGGSSGGSAVAVVTGDADVAIGTDQAGSVRVPAAWCGCVGLKPTHGLVSYRGAVPLGHSFDHVGPLARTVEDTARALAAMTGRDPLDPRQRDVRPDGYVEAARDASADGLTVGVLAEGFDPEYTDPGVDATVRTALEELEAAGADIEDVSVPFHDEALAISLPVMLENIVAVWESEGTGQFVGGHYDTQFAARFRQARRASADAFGPTVKHVFLLGGYLREMLQGRYHGVASNLRQRLRDAYDDELEAIDLLAMPTTPMTAFERADPESRVELVNRAQGKAGRGRNTMAFNMTGHPALSVPVGKVDGLPVGMTLLADHFDEATTLRAAGALEDRLDYDVDPATGGVDGREA